MSRPRMEELAISAVAYSRGYPRFSISGIKSGPMAAIPVRPEPEIAPMMAQETAATTPRPPRTWPIKAFTNRSREAAIPLWDMIVPARTKSGMANSTGLPSCWKPQSIMPFIVTSPMKYITIRAAPKQ